MTLQSLPRLDGRVAIVTGASRGIGRNMAVALADAGCAVVIAARSTDENPRLPGTIHAVAARIEAAGGRALAAACDVTSEDGIAAVVATTMERFGRIDCLINNAGVMSLARTEQTTLKRWELVLRVNLTGTFLFTKAVLPVMRAQRSGSLVAITTGGVRMTDVATGGGSNAYWVSKAAIERFYAGLASELAPDGIAVNCLAPSGVVLTEGWQVASGGMQIPEEHVEAPELMGRAAVLLAAQDARGITGRVLSSRQLAGPEPGVPRG
ncbi:SDR family NAD(P)-dependent oxidoreductase [Candidatus Binatia bacterium]|jgi:NAD(P)-dependent dehydrogenase (short-subunit alcohol dehydrogenase family)|nr:SDR family NAD(P)-dependent oxidoreductase [Candidatus Binatia bacterium]